jgi:hypothetical protein
MRDNANWSSNLISINDKLSEIKGILRDTLQFSLEEIKNNPSSEKEILDLWSDYVMSLGDLFFEESEKINNKKLYKRMVRALMFKN